MTGWVSLYGDCDDQAITALANAGLLRRGRKDTAAGLISVVSENDSEVVVSVGASGAKVRLSDKGPAAAACDCATAGICQHVVSALLWAREHAPAADEGAVTPPVSKEDLPPPQGHIPRRSTVQKNTAADRRRAEAIAEVRATVEPLIATGLAHLGPEDAAQLLAVAGRVRAAGVEAINGVQLAALVRASAALIEELTGRDDTVDEVQLLDALAETWALTEAIPSTQAGSATSSSAEQVDIARLIPLGARWWTSPAGARGVTFMAWDPSAARVRSATTGRAAGTDPAFQRSWDIPILWGSSLARLCASEIALSKVQLKSDGTLGAAGDSHASPGAAFTADALASIAEATAATVAPREVVGFGRRPTQVRLHMLRDSGEVGLDEVRQEMTWSVTTSDSRQHQLRLPVAEGFGVDTLLGAIAVSSRVVAVAVERDRDREVPVGLFVVRDRDGITLVCPTLTPRWQVNGTTRWAAWRSLTKRLEALRKGAVNARPPTMRPTAAERVCTLVGDVLLAVAATGRLRLTSSQRTDLLRARVLARDLGLGTLERVATEMAAVDEKPVSPEAVLRAAFVVARTRAVLTV